MTKPCGSSRAVAALTAAFATGALALAAGPDAGGLDAPASRYAVAPKTVPPVAGASSEYVAENPANNLRLAFSPTGVIASPGLTGTTGWSLDLRPVGVSFDGRPAPTSSPSVSVSGNRVDYDFGALHVAYVNTPSGLEQRSSIVAPTDRGKEVVLELSVDGGLKPRKAGYYIDLVSAAGELVLRLGPVEAMGADGIPLDAHLEVAADDKGNATGARVVIRANNAEYPIEVSARLISPTVGKPAGAVSASGATSAAIVGVPITIQSGISETVSQIMERDRLTPPYLLGIPRVPHNEIDVELELNPDPNAPPPLSHWPPIPETSSGVVVGPPNLPQTVGTSFKGVAYSESFFIPPDSNGDVGPSQILIHTNGRVKLFDKSGAAGFLNSASNTFWASQSPRTHTGDSQVRYDRLSGRWFLMTIDFLVPNNKVLLAVSDGSSITPSSYFTFYSFVIGSVLPADASNWCDYPSLGIDANALYIGCNMFNTAGAFQYASGMVVRKSSLIGGGPPSVTGFSGIAAVGLPGPFAPRGVDNDDPSWTEGYFIGPEPGSTSNLSLRRISDPGGTPTLGPSMALPVSNTAVLDQPALSSTRNIDTVGLRLFAASIHKNKITGVTSLWTAHSVETDATCTPSGGSGLRLGAKWYEIGNLKTTPAITQFGTLCTTAAGNGNANSERGFPFPTVVGTGQGHMALAASYASATEFVGVAAAGRLRTDPPAGTRAPETIVLAGLASYTIEDSVPRNRWGDYSFTDVDPNDDQTVWTIQEYADTPSNNWAVRAVQLKAPPPPSTATGGLVCVGVAAALVNIVGADICAAPTCSNGLCTGGGPCAEFFDPGPDTGGPGYVNHLTATVTGSVTVNSANIIIPANPTTQRVRGVALSLNTTAAATGTKSVTITNPDGQARTYANVITVIGNRLPVANTGGPYSSCQGGSVVLNGTGSTDPDAACGDSLVSYEWDLNNDATFDITGATPTVTWAELAGLGLGVGPHTIKLRVTDTHGAVGTGSGTLTILVDGSACDDANACTTGDACGGGVCAGTVIPAPPETQDLSVDEDKATYTWSAAAGATRYDVVRGSLSALPVGPGGGDEVCFNDLAATMLVDPLVPDPDTGFWYLSRGENACGSGTYGAQSNATPRTTTTCP